jgi:hypothetical protein
MMERLNIEKADGGAGITIGKVGINPSVFYKKCSKNHQK